ncbi:nucleotidyltransferase domain-containing protein [Acrocarpospora macrocephala]|uniref:Nucleotidyltransferase n=1 Tax=Acrocarpospora macrocephala TaxID=150177 RepID=A0A5M3X2Y0_9ACTN|nr:nucleotidyltransferase domain-containing protein [Acrocarpospora macrocephala]GES13961.1 nucleotidyltransferase [Acrocarpospora macrocephala]
MDLIADHTVLSVVVGSRAYGLDTAESDTDRRGVYAAPAALFWRLDKPPTHLDGPLPEQFSWELERFLTLALACNPTVLECLWSPIVERITPIGTELLALRHAFLSRRARETFLEYADAQFKRLTPESPKWKQAMHMIRLLISGRHLVRHGEPLVHMGEHRDRLLAVRRGEVAWSELRAWRDELTADLGASAGVLPEHPDRAAVEEFLVAARKSTL